MFIAALFIITPDPLEEGMATHSSIFAWRIPWTEEPQRAGHDLAPGHTCTHSQRDDCYLKTGGTWVQVTGSRETSQKRQKWGVLLGEWRTQSVEWANSTRTEEPKNILQTDENSTEKSGPGIFKSEKQERSEEQRHQHIFLFIFLTHLFKGGYLLNRLKTKFSLNLYYNFVC